MDKKTTGEENYVWYLQPMSKSIDWSITLGIADEAGGDTTAHMVRCADGRRRNLIECSKELCIVCVNSYKIGVDFNIYRKNSRDAQIQSVNFLFRKRRRRSHTAKWAHQESAP